MALVNPQIAMSFRPTTEYQPRNALAEYAQLQAIQAGRQAQELNALKMQEAQAALEERNALRSLNPSSEDYESQLFKVSPQLGIQFRREAAATAAQRAAQQKSEFDLTTARRKFAEDLKRGLSANPSDENIIAFGQDALLQNLYTPDQVKSEVSRLLALPVPDRVRILSQAGASAADLRPQVIGGRLVSSAGNVLYAAPSAIGAIEAEIAALKAQGAADTDPRIVARQGKIRQLSGAPGPTEIANIEAEIAALKGQGVADTDPRIVARQNKIRQLSGAPGPTEIANVEAEVAALRAQGVPDTDPRIVARQNKIRQLSGAPGPTEIAVLETEIAALKAQGAADTDPRIVTRQGKITQLSGGPAPAEIRTMQSLGYPLTQAGYASFRAAQMRETQQQPPALVPILRDGKPVLVPREEAVGQTPFSPTAVQVLGMGPGREPSAQSPAAAQPRPLTAAQEAARRDKLGKEFKSATAALQTTQDVLDSISFVRAEPGLSRATGFTGTFLPSIPEGAAAAAETRLRNLEGKVTALGKAQAAATGAIGSIANQEWQILRDQIAAIDRTKGTGPLLKQLELVELQAQGAMARIRDAYQRQFGEDFERFPQFSNLPAPSSSFTPRAPAGGAGRAAPAAGGVDANNPLLR